MRLGVIARSEDRGLGNQTWEVCRHLNPDRVLLVNPNPTRHAQHPERYADWDTTPIGWRGGPLDERTVRTWLAGLDVVYTAETFYDQRMPRWAREAGCEPVCHVNPEFFPRDWAELDATWWAPSPWRFGMLPRSARLVPMPVATDRIRPISHDGLRVLHVGGLPATSDRNGTAIVEAATPDIDAPVTIASQANNQTANYWDLYTGHDILVMPRRYGGLCLPVQEAMAAGLAVVMTDIEPNGYWPGPRVGVRKGRTIATPGGPVTVYDANPDDLAATVNRLLHDPAELQHHRDASLAWAAANSWDALTDHWLEAMQPCRSLS